MEHRPDMSAPPDHVDRSQDPLRSTVVLVPDPALVLSGAGVVLAVNDAAGELLDSGELVGSRLEDLLEDPHALARLQDEAARAGLVTGRELTFRLAGERVPIEGSFRPFDPGGDGTGMLVLRDGGRREESSHGTVGREAVLQAIAFATERLMRTDDWGSSVSDVLKTLGTTLDVSRVYLFEVLADEGFDTIVRQRLEWVAPGVQPQIDAPELQALPLEASGFRRWQQVMSTGGVIHGHVADMPLEEQALLEAQDIVSLLAVPIEVEGRWWGFVGFDECRTERVWSVSEIDTLRVAAGILAVTMQQHAARYALERSAEAYADAYRTEREAVERLQALDAMKDGLIEAVSHEVRTPLAAVAGFAETLQRLDLAADPQLTGELLAGLARNTTRLRRLLADLLDLNRSAGQLPEVAPTTLELAGVVDDVVEDLGWLLQGRRIEVELGAELVFLDPYVVSRVLENLVRNAAHHTPSGRTIWVRTARLPGGRIVLDVEDDGPGIPDELKHAVLEPFRRGPSAPRHAPGAGVGLTVVSRLAAAHGGTVTIGDRPGAGCRVRVELVERRVGAAVT